MPVFTTIFARLSPIQYSSQHILLQQLTIPCSLGNQPLLLLPSPGQSVIEPQVDVSCSVCCFELSRVPFLCVVHLSLIEPPASYNNAASLFPLESFRKLVMIPDTHVLCKVRKYALTCFVQITAQCVCFQLYSAMACKLTGPTYESGVGLYHAIQLQPHAPSSPNTFSCGLATSSRCYEQI